MNKRTPYRKLIIGFVLLFFAGIIFTNSAKSQDNPVSITPLSTVSDFQSPKDSTMDPNRSTPSPPIMPDNTEDNDIPLPFPETSLSLEKNCSPTTINLDEEIECTITIKNNNTEDLSYKVLDLTSPRLTIQEDSIEGGDLYKHNFIVQRDTLAGAILPALVIEKNETPLAYNSLRELGVPPLSDVTDDSIINLSTINPYIYNGQEYTFIGMTSNGYLVAGLGSDEDISYTPQIFPDPTIPNNVIAPFWADLDPEAGGNLYAALLTRDNISWIVLEWEDVPAFASEKPPLDCTENCIPIHTFQVWIETNTTEQAVTFIYVNMPDPSAVLEQNIGAEDIDGIIGANYESVPMVEDELMVVSTPGTEGESHIISYTATPNSSGQWHSCALMKILQVQEITFDCNHGAITE